MPGGGGLTLRPGSRNGAQKRGCTLRQAHQGDVHGEVQRDGPQSFEGKHICHLTNKVAADFCLVTVFLVGNCIKMTPVPHLISTLVFIHRRECFACNSLPFP